MKIVKSAQGLSVEIPADVAAALDLHEGMEVEISPVRSKRKLSGVERAQAIERLRRFRGTAPADFTFDREEANAR